MLRRVILIAFLVALCASATGAASMKKPLEARVWFNYPNQTSEHSIGQTDQPSKIVRAVETPGGGRVWAMERTLFAQPEDANPNRIENPYGLPVGRIDSEGRRLRYRYDTNNRDLIGVDAYDAGNWRTLLTLAGYASHLPATVTAASGLVTSYAYNTAGQVIQISLSKGGNSEVTKLYYVAAPAVDPGTGTPTFAAGSQTAAGYLVKIERTAPGGGFVTLAQFTYDSAKRVRRAKDADGYILKFDYDNFNRVTLVTHPDTTTEQFDYQRLDLHAVKDRGGLWSRTFHNALRQPVVFQDPKGRITSLEWCRCGDIRKLIDPLGKVTWWKRDIQGRMEEKLMPDGTSKTEMDYQPLSGRLASVTLPNDSASQSPTVAYAYNLAGQVTGEDYTAANTPDAGYTYNDFLGRLTGHTDGLGASGYTYHPIDNTTPGAGEVATINGPRTNDTLRYTYDWQDRITQRELLTDASAVQRDQLVTIDKLGRLDSMANGLGFFDASYNAGNIGDRIDAVTGPNGMRTDFAYYALAAADGKALRLFGITNTRSAAAVSSFTYDFDKSGRINTWGRTQGGALSMWSLEYSRASEVAAGTLRNASAQVVDSRRYSYDASGNRVLEDKAGVATNARYNALNQLKTIGGAGPVLIEGTVNEPATVTVNGQPAEVKDLPGTGTRFEKAIEGKLGVNTVAVVAKDKGNNLNIVANRNWSFTLAPVEKLLHYDLNGNLKADDTRTMTWDAKNRLLSVSIGGTNYEWEYDGLGRRVREKRNGTLYREWIYDGPEMIQERDATGAVTKTFYPEGVTIGGAHYFYTFDHLGNIRELVDAAGTVRASYDYDFYGNRTKLSGDFDADFAFTGHYWHPETGLILAPGRAYDPELGRWISPDSGLFAEFLPEGSNLYGYVGANVTGLIDPTGNFAFVPFLIGIGVSITLDYVIDNYVAPYLRCYAADNFGCDALNALDNLGNVLDIARSLKNPVRGLRNVRAIAGSGRGSEILSRLGTSRESAARLSRKASEAEGSIGIHGVSTTAGRPAAPASQAARDAVESRFRVHNTPTRNDPLHRTVELPKPVTPQVANDFNSIFGRD